MDNNPENYYDYTINSSNSNNNDADVNDYYNAPATRNTGRASTTDYTNMGYEYGEVNNNNEAYDNKNTSNQQVSPTSVNRGDQFRSTSSEHAAASASSSTPLPTTPTSFSQTSGFSTFASAPIVGGNVNILAVEDAATWAKQRLASSWSAPRAAGHMDGNWVKQFVYQHQQSVSEQSNIDIFSFLETPIKIRLLMSIISMKKQQINELRVPYLQQFVHMGLEDSDEWVRVISEIVFPLVYDEQRPRLNTSLQNKQFISAIDHFKQKVRTLSNDVERLVPLEYQYLSRSAVSQRAEQQQDLQAQPLSKIIASNPHFKVKAQAVEELEAPTKPAPVETSKDSAAKAKGPLQKLNIPRSTKPIERIGSGSAAAGALASPGPASATKKTMFSPAGRGAPSTPKSAGPTPSASTPITPASAFLNTDRYSNNKRGRVMSIDEDDARERVKQQEEAIKKKRSEAAVTETDRERKKREKLEEKTKKKEEKEAQKRQKEEEKRRAQEEKAQAAEKAALVMAALQAKVEQARAGGLDSDDDEDLAELLAVATPRSRGRPPASASHSAATSQQGVPASPTMAKPKPPSATGRGRGRPKLQTKALDDNEIPAQKQQQASISNKPATPVSPFGQQQPFSPQQQPPHSPFPQAPFGSIPSFSVFPQPAAPHTNIQPPKEILSSFGPRQTAPGLSPSSAAANQSASLSQMLQEALSDQTPQQHQFTVTPFALGRPPQQPQHRPMMTTTPQHSQPQQQPLPQPQQQQQQQQQPQPQQQQHAPANVRPPLLAASAFSQQIARQPQQTLPSHLLQQQQRPQPPQAQAQQLPSPHQLQLTHLQQQQQQQQSPFSNAPSFASILGVSKPPLPQQQQQPPPKQPYTNGGATPQSQPQPQPQPQKQHPPNPYPTLPQQQQQQRQTLPQTQAQTQRTAVPTPSQMLQSQPQPQSHQPPHLQQAAPPPAPPPQLQPSSQTRPPAPAQQQQQQAARPQPLPQPQQPPPPQNPASQQQQQQQHQQ